MSLSVSAMLLSVGAVASAASVEQVTATETGAGTVTVIFTPAEGERAIFTPQDQNVPLSLGSVYYMEDVYWMILYESNVVSLSGNKVTMAGTYESTTSYTQ